MKVVGVIAELNPFHEGHAYLLESIRKERGADAIILVMSTDFVQRGEPAILPYTKRVHDALENGADLILSLPVRWSLASAESFAFGAVATLLSTGLIDEIVCGTEGELDNTFLQDISEYLLMEPEEYKIKLQAALKTGLSFPKARLLALSNQFDGNRLTFLQSANNILATEYRKALHHFHSHCTLTGIPRKAGYSAHQKRERMVMEKQEAILPDDFTATLHYSHWFHTHILHTAPYDKDSEFNKELFNRYCNQITPQHSLTQIIQTLKTKQYTYTRISRILFRYLLCLPYNNEKGSLADYAPYLRVLGFRRDSKNLLSLLLQHAKVPVIKKLANDEKKLTKDGQILLQQELSAQALYQSVAGQKYPHWQLKNAYETGMIIV